MNDFLWGIWSIIGPTVSVVGVYLLWLFGAWVAWMVLSLPFRIVRYYATSQKLKRMTADAEELQRLQDEVRQ